MKVYVVFGIAVDKNLDIHKDILRVYGRKPKPEEFEDTDFYDVDYEEFEVIP